MEDLAFDTNIQICSLLCILFRELDVDVPQAEGVSVLGGLLHLPCKVKQLKVHRFSSVL